MGKNLGKRTLGILAHNRTLTAQLIEMADDMRLALTSGSEITSSTVGHAVLERLKALDEVAYMRFASVYKNFDDAAAFRRELALLKQS